ncbi:hypothetical protein BDV06DRAFT_183494 [Aspergillus oleicola]
MKQPRVQIESLSITSLLLILYPAIGATNLAMTSSMTASQLSQRRLQIGSLDKL